MGAAAIPLIAAGISAGAAVYSAKQQKEIAQEQIDNSKAIGASQTQEYSDTSNVQAATAKKLAAMNGYNSTYNSIYGDVNSNRKSLLGG
jgi:hypothetical protein